MKQFSLLFNILLTAAVATLFYLHFAGDKHTCKPASLISPSKDSCALGHVMAYVQMDSVYEKVTYIQQKQKELDNEQNQIARQYQDAYAQLESKSAGFAQKGNSASQQEMEAFREKLYQEQQAIEAKKQNQAQQMALRRNQVMEEIQKNMRSFLDEFNKDKRYSYIVATGTGMDILLYKDSTHNITAEVIEGLNRQFSQQAAKK